MPSRNKSLIKRSISVVRSAAGNSAMIIKDEITFSVLGYREDNCWAALALEFDLLGHGDTPKQALEELMGVVTAQLEFAIEQGDPSLLDFPAEKKYFSLFDKARKQVFLKEYFSCVSDPQQDNFAQQIPVAELKPGGQAHQYA